MSDPTIEMIDKSLRSCSLNGRRRAIRSPAVTSPPPGWRRREVTVELNSGIPLPCFWEQCLDIRVTILVDMEGCLRARNLLVKKLTELEKEAYTLSGTLSLNSTADITDLLCTQLKLPVSQGCKKGKLHPSTDKHALNMLRRDSLDEYLKLGQKECYAPSKVSVDWSVATSEPAFDKAGIRPFSNIRSINLSAE